jgi:serine/threonine protein kinase
LGIGSFAEVYLGLHIHLGTEAAIKLLHAQLARPAEVEKFRQEAQTIAALKHPSIVRVLDFGIEQGAPYLVMDYAPNGSLRQRVARGQPAAPATIAPYVQQVAEALQYAHDQKLVHRDIKPENMLLGQRHEVLLSDFGIAVALQQTRTHLTVHGFSGTAVYAAPEQFKGQVGPASDQYALAVVVYEWLTDERPFQGDDLIAIGMAKSSSPRHPYARRYPRFR